MHRHPENIIQRDRTMSVLEANKINWGKALNRSIRKLLGKYAAHFTMCIWGNLINEGCGSRV